MTDSECVCGYVFDSANWSVVSPYDAGKLCMKWPEVGGKALPYYYDAAGVKTICMWSVVSKPGVEDAKVAVVSAESYSCPYGHVDVDRIDLVAWWHACDVGD